MFRSLRRRITELEKNLETLAAVVGVSVDDLPYKDAKTHLSNPRLNALGRIDENRKRLEETMEDFSKGLLHLSKRITLLLDFLGLEETKPTAGGEIMKKTGNEKKTYNEKGAMNNTKIENEVGKLKFRTDSLSCAISKGIGELDERIDKLESRLREGKSSKHKGGL